MPSLEASTARWRKSSFSSNTSDCVEVAFLRFLVGVRDSKNSTGPVLTFPEAAWYAFLDRTDTQR
jgi:Domain of unknown function (DUF397)